MTTKLTPTCSFFVLLLLLLTSHSFGQKLLESRQSSYHTYIYRLTNQEAEKIFRKGIKVVEPTWFHSLVDSFATHTEYTGKLSTGHYLKTRAERNQQQFELYTVSGFDVQILNNNTDLCIQVYDLSGRIITDANVQIGFKNLRFDKKTQAYTDKKSNLKGLLTVSHNGFTGFYPLNRQINKSGFRQKLNVVLWRTPLKYAWRPIDYLLFMPVDGVKSIKNGWPQGRIYQTKRFFEKSYHKVACLFDDYHCDYYSTKSQNEKYDGYLVFNKPKYQPGDTLKFKSFIVTKKGKPVSTPADVVLYNGQREIKLTRLTPYAPGGFETQFQLHDSLNLRLDRFYALYLKRNKEKSYITSSFKYEDYELKGIKLAVRVKEPVHYKGKSLNLFAKGTDANDLNLQDGRLEIVARTVSHSEAFKTWTFFPDTLMLLKKELAKSGETEIILPDSLFPAANFTYELELRLLTSDNETLKETRRIDYFHTLKEIKAELQNDSIVFSCYENGKAIQKEVSVSTSDKFGNKTELFKAVTPCKTALNAYYSYYIVKSDTLTKTVDLSSLPSLLQCYSDRTNDSVFITVDNPRKLPFTYTIYKRNNEIARGYTDSLKLAKNTPGLQNYFVSLRYLWGGEIQEETFKIPYHDKALSINILQPRLVYPGQKSKIEIEVTNPEGKPVSDVDLTAYGLTTKFNHAAPTLPYLGKERKNKTVINNFHFSNQKTETHSGLPLNYPQWKALAHLDSIEYYKFIYPGNHIYRFEYETPDSIAQFAPFVVSNGGFEPVHVVYLDNKPVYFSWTTNIQPYSFKVDSGYHQVKLRTPLRIITIDSLYFNPGKKLIFSVDESILHKNITVQKTESKLSQHEKNVLYQYTFPYRNNFGERYAYLEQSNNVQLLKPQNRNNRSMQLAGPIVGNVSFHLIDSFTTHFKHEPYFEYDIAPGLLKMRTINTDIIYPQRFTTTSDEKPLNDNILTKEKIRQQWNSFLEAKRKVTPRYKYPTTTTAGNGRLQLQLTGLNASEPIVPLNTLLFKHDNHQFLRIYPGSISILHQLEEGYYKLLLFYPGSSYQVVDSITVKPNGLTRYNIQQPSTFTHDEFSQTVSKLIEENLFKPTPYSFEEEKELGKIVNSYQQNFKYTGEGMEVEGVVVADEDGLPLPGVSVVVKGTTFGTVTNIDGYYTLKVPKGYSTLLFSFIGMVEQEIDLGYHNVANVRMEAEALAMDEVVVVGYGVQKKSSITASATTVATTGTTRGIRDVSANLSQVLQGQVSGVQITGNETNGVTITIRGSSTTQLSGTPLYIINGQVFTGNISELDQNLIHNIEVLKGESATALYGSRAVNGVVIISTKNGAFKTTASPASKGADYDEAFFNAASSASSIRNNFSDDAFWQPRLRTDKNGKASFEVTFPDDVTSWQTNVLAMNGKRQSGQATSTIKSYKPLMAQLSVPRFLVEGDSTIVLGKSLNYTPDSVEITTRFEINGKTFLTHKQLCHNALLDTLAIVAPHDSIQVKYALQSPDGYLDGEQRDIPVFPIGLEETIGDFYVLNNDTTITLATQNLNGTLHLYARADMLNVVEDEISRLIKYKYSCNEQLASKLKALLAEMHIYKYAGQKQTKHQEIEKLIRLLLNNQKEHGLWGWWKNSTANHWISLHVLEALYQAKNLGFEVKLNTSQASEQLVWELENSSSVNEKLRILKLLRLINTQMSYHTWLEKLEQTPNLPLHNQFQLLELKQLCNIKINTDSILKHKKETLFGNIYFAHETATTSLLENEVQNTLLAYRILRKDSASHAPILQKIRNFLMEKRTSGSWANTFESAQIIETILPDLLTDKTKVEKPTLTLSGDVTKSVTAFPFEMTVEPGKQITVRKLGDFPVYLTTWQHHWNRTPVFKSGDFEIRTTFSNGSQQLTAGKTVKLKATVTLKKDAEYVMINIPIPAGCSYGEKAVNYRMEAHREYFKNETAIFCEHLKKGEHTFEIELIPRYTGTYTLNPAKIELMYFPTFNANNQVKRTSIK
jgi:TonB-dependent SusC/RagA subfamily outer membrane receptor